MIKYALAFLLAAVPAFAQEPDHTLLKAAAIGIVSNQNCGGEVFSDVQIVSWIFSGSVQAGLAEGQAIDVTRIYVAQILAGIRTRQQLNEFCREMFKIGGEPT
jgi:hypothetical protein